MRFVCRRAVVAILLLLGAAGCLQPINRIVWIEPAPGRTVRDVLQTGLPFDVWETDRYHLVARGSDLAIAALAVQGHHTVVLFASEAAYRAARNGPALQLIATVRCGATPDCAELAAPGRVTQVVNQDVHQVLVRVTWDQLSALLRDGFEAHLLRLAD
jgi:hypothetical protein